MKNAAGNDLFYRGGAAEKRVEFARDGPYDEDNEAGEFCVADKEIL